MKLKFSALAFLLCFFQVAFAQDEVEREAEAASKPKKTEVTSTVETNLMQFAKLTQGNNVIPTYPRYSYFFNMGAELNFIGNRTVVPFTGLQLKNIGLISQLNDSLRRKERVYVLGVPLGLKFYSNNKKFMFKVGADAGLAINYKVKDFINDEKVSKSNQYFSKKTSSVFSSLFAGFSYDGFAISCNYYLNNFYNSSSINKANIVSVGLGLDFNRAISKRKK